VSGFSTLRLLLPPPKRQAENFHLAYKTRAINADGGCGAFRHNTGNYATRQHYTLKYAESKGEKVAGLCRRFLMYHGGGTKNVCPRHRHHKNSLKIKHKAAKAAEAGATRQRLP